jgi:hypothetical protein
MAFFQNKPKEEARCWSYSYSGRTKQLTQPCHQLTEQEKGVYVWDLRPTERIIKQFITMLRIQSPPYSCNSITRHSEDPSYHQYRQLASANSPSIPESPSQILQLCSGVVLNKRPYVGLKPHRVKIRALRPWRHDGRYLCLTPKSLKTLKDDTEWYRRP